MAPASAVVYPSLRVGLDAPPLEIYQQVPRLPRAIPAPDSLPELPCRLPGVAAARLPPLESATGVDCDA